MYIVWFRKLKREKNNVCMMREVGREGNREGRRERERGEKKGKEEKNLSHVLDLVYL